MILSDSHSQIYWTAFSLFLWSLLPYLLFWSIMFDALLINLSVNLISNFLGLALLFILVTIFSVLFPFKCMLIANTLLFSLDYILLFCIFLFKVTFWKVWLQYQTQLSRNFRGQKFMSFFFSYAFASTMVYSPISGTMRDVHTLFAFQSSQFTFYK